MSESGLDFQRSNSIKRLGTSSFHRKAQLAELALQANYTKDQLLQSISGEIRSNKVSHYMANDQTELNDKESLGNSRGSIPFNTFDDR